MVLIDTLIADLKLTDAEGKFMVSSFFEKNIIVVKTKIPLFLKCIA